MAAAAQAAHAVQPRSAMSGVRLQGILKKKSRGFLSRWQKRYFVLDSVNLSYYAEPKHFDPSRPPNYNELQLLGVHAAVLIPLQFVLQHIYCLQHMLHMSYSNTCVYFVGHPSMCACQLALQSCNRAVICQTDAVQHLMLAATVSHISLFVRFNSLTFT